MIENSIKCPKKLLILLQEYCIYTKKEKLYQLDMASLKPVF